MKTEDFPKFKFYVNIIGDESVGIFGGEAVVTIQDNIRRSKQYDIIILKESIASMYDVSIDCVVTELKHTQDQLTELKMEMEMLKDQIEEVKSNKLLRKLNDALRSGRRKKDTLQKKIRKLKRYYIKHDFFFPEKRIEEEKLAE